MYIKDLKRLIRVLVPILQAFECSPYVLPLFPRAQAHPESSSLSVKRSQGSTKELEWIGWNDASTSRAGVKTFQGTPIARAGGGTDWSWKKEDRNENVEGKTLKFHVLEDTINGDVHKPNWLNKDKLYVPYSFKHKGHHQKHLHVHNSLHQYPFRPHSEYVWKDLQQMHGSPQQEYHQTHIPSIPQHASHGAEFGSVGSASSPLGLGASLGDHFIGQGSSYGKPGRFLTGFSDAYTNRKYGNENLDRYYAQNQYPYQRYASRDRKRKRYRLEVHPGFIAAPIAGLAAFGVAHAFTSKPVLFEFGLVGKKKGLAVNHLEPLSTHHVPAYPLTAQKPKHHHHLSHHSHSHHRYPHHYHQRHHDSDSKVPEIPHLQPHQQARPTEVSDVVAGESKPSWWNPFAAMVPRIRTQVERD